MPPASSQLLTEMYHLIGECREDCGCGCDDGDEQEVPVEPEQPENESKKKKRWQK
jgi:hypothetical protein